MKRKVDPAELKYPFRSLFLAKCASEGVRPNFGKLKEAIANQSGYSTTQITRLMLAKKDSVLTANNAVLSAFSKELGVEVALLTTSFVFGERGAAL